MSKINIAFGITKDWLKHSFVTVCSILSNSKNNSFKFFFMSDISESEFSEQFEPIYRILKGINSQFCYEYIRMDNSDFDGVVHDKRVGISAYYRLKLASLTNEDRMIYLDSDVVVLGDISELWNYDIKDYFLGAVEDKYSELMTCHAGLEDGYTYINSGVMLMNLKSFRERGLEEKFFKKLREEDNDYSDQDVINDICRGGILYLPLKYNLMLTTDDPNSFPKRKEEYNEALKSPFILHYSIKPWILPVQYSKYWRKYSDILNLTY